MRLWELVRQSVESVTRSRLRTSLTSLGVAIATGALVSMVAFALGLQAQMEVPFQQLGLLNNIEVRPKKANENGDSDSGVLDDAALDQFESLPGVQYAYPDLRITQTEVVYEKASQRATAVGLPREAGLIGFFSDVLVAGSYFSLGEEPEAVLGTRLVEGLGFASPEQAVGRKVSLVASGLVSANSEQQYEFQRESFEVVIVGVYEPPSIAARLGGDSLLLPVDLMRDLPGTAIEQHLNRMRNQQGVSLDGFAQVIVHTERPSDVFHVETEIREMGFQTYALINRLEEARTAFLFMEVLLTAVGTIALVVAGLGIVNTLLMSVLERYQEIGIYKAVGASDHDIRILFLTEAALVGLLGGLGGLVLARVVSWFIQWGVGMYAADQGMRGPLVLFDFPLWLLSGAVLFAIVTSIVSDCIPPRVLRASIRFEHCEASEKRKRGNTRTSSLTPWIRRSPDWSQLATEAEPALAAQR